jgi:acetoacetyl-CoA synthetase
LPNIPEAVVGMLAATSLGAVWSSCSPDFGTAGLLDRFGQIKPKLLITADAYVYNGKRHDCLERVAAAAQRLPSVERVVVVPYIDRRPNIDRLPGAILWSTLLESAIGREIAFERLPFSQPIYILYSSGTTGAPKCIVHGAGGTLLQHMKELVLHTDLNRDDRIIYYTTCGWMMWNWLVSALAVGSTVLLYDGAPFQPATTQIFDILAAERVSVFGTSAKYLSAAEKEGLAPRETHDLSALRTILSTGSTLTPESFDYVYEHVKRDVCLASISGGTDIISCFALGNPLGSVFRGQLQARGLGMAVAIYDEQGGSIRGEKGELVCEAAFPSIPVGFWNDPDDVQFRNAYFSRYPGVWHHGDYAELTDEEGVIVYGRSDATLNPGGVRIGTSEIYRQVEQHDDVLESIVVGQEQDGDVRIVLFVKLRPGKRLDSTFIQRIKDGVRASATPRHVPAKVIQVADIPRTKSGKIVELAVREVIHDRPVKNLIALANPEALEHFKNLSELSD